MKRYLNVGQPPAPAGAYGFDINATDQSVASAEWRQRFRLPPRLAWGASPAAKPIRIGNYPSFTKDVFAAESNPYYAAFVEDTYHASKALTITAGLRWDIFGGRNERYNRQEYFNPNISNSFEAASLIPARKSTSTAAIAPRLQRICTTLDPAWVSPGSPPPTWSYAAAQASITVPARTTSVAPC
jgi:hypothetical protein